jgi:hypothetical protein
MSEAPVTSEAPVPPLAYTQPGDTVKQFGRVKTFDRSLRGPDLITAAMAWVLADVCEVMSELGVDVNLVLPTLQTYFVDAVEAPFAHTGDPLYTTEAQKFPRVTGPHTAGWKVALVFAGGAVPDHPALLIEGVTPIAA